MGGLLCQPEKDIHYYLSLPYTIELIREDDETWFARVKELPGCITEGDSAQDAAEMILDAMHGWVEIALADGQTIPEPRPVEDYSGKFVVRVPKITASGLGPRGGPSGYQPQSVYRHRTGPIRGPPRCSRIMTELCWGLTETAG